MRMEKPQIVVKQPPQLKQIRSVSVASNPDEKDKVKVNLSNSCFNAIPVGKKPLDLDLTNLNWLQNNNLLRGIHSGNKTGCISPPQDMDMDLSFVPGTHILGGAVKHNSSSKMNLNNVKNSPRKPPYSFSSLIFMAIEDSPNKRLPVKDIYQWITERFPYFRNAPLGWKNSVRHNLSLNKCFKKVDKDKGQAMGKGSLWCVDVDYRPNLMQALRKTPSFHPYVQWTTPPPSPQRLSGSTARALESTLLQSITQSGRSTPNVDPEAEAAAVATMCLMGGNRSSEDVESIKVKSRPHRSTFSDLLSVAVSLDKAQRSRKKGRGMSPSSSMDSEYEFYQHCSDESDREHESEAMDSLINDDSLEDSGYGDSLPKSRSSEKNCDVIDGADALLELASKACALKRMSIREGKGGSAS